MTWKIDSAHTRVAFSIRHMLISNVHGQFRKLDGTLDIDEAQPTRSSVDLQIEAASIDTRCEMRDAHLRSADYFDAEHYPYLTFKSKHIEVVDDRHGKIQGVLTIKGITHGVVLNVEYSSLTQSPWGASTVGLVWLLGFYGLVFGLAWLILALRLRGFHHTVESLDKELSPASI